MTFDLTGDQDLDGQKIYIWLIFLFWLAKIYIDSLPHHNSSIHTVPIAHTYMKPHRTFDRQDPTPKPILPSRVIKTLMGSNSSRVKGRGRGGWWVFKMSDFLCIWCKHCWKEILVVWNANGLHMKINVCQMDRQVNFIYNI